MAKRRCCYCARPAVPGTRPPLCEAHLAALQVVAAAQQAERPLEPSGESAAGSFTREQLQALLKELLAGDRAG